MNEEDCADAAWLRRTMAALAKLPIDPPPEREPVPVKKVDPNFYCTTCDSSYCTCKGES